MNKLPVLFPWEFDDYDHDEVKKFHRKLQLKINNFADQHSLNIYGKIAPCQFLIYLKGIEQQICWLYFVENQKIRHIRKRFPGVRGKHLFRMLKSGLTHTGKASEGHYIHNSAQRSFRLIIGKKVTNITFDAELRIDRPTFKNRRIRDPYIFKLHDISNKFTVRSIEKLKAAQLI